MTDTCNMKPKTTTSIELLFIITVLCLNSASAQIQVSGVTNSGYSQNFDTLPTNGTWNPWNNNSTLPGWYINQTKTPYAVTNCQASSGSLTSGAIYSFGLSASPTQRALGSIPTSTPGDFAYGVRFANDTRLAMTNITVSFTGEQWRRTSGGGTQTVAFSYSVSSSMITNADAGGAMYDWTHLPELDFNSPNLGATGALNGSAATNRQNLTSVLVGVLLLPGQELFLRWLDVDDPGAIDYAMGIDDVTVRFSPTTFFDPTITTQPTNRTNVVQTAAMFSVAVASSSPLRYQWYKGNTPLTDNDRILGATNEALTILQVVHADAGNYSVVVGAGSGSLTSAPAGLTVTGFAIAPVAATNTIAGTPVSVGIRFIDNQSPVTYIRVASSNEELLPDAAIVAGVTNSTGSATLVPRAGTNGVALVTITASDGTFSTSTVFPLLVLASTDVLFNDHFNYSDGPITSNSFGLWRRYSGAQGEFTVTNGSLQISRSLTEDVAAVLLGQPYPSTSSTVLYSRFTLKATDLPTATGNYFACFKDSSSSGFRARVWISTTNAATAGKFRLGIGNGSHATAATAQVDQDLDLQTNYVVVTRLVVSNCTASIWINPASEDDIQPSTHAIASDTPSTPGEITSYAFREDGGEGILRVDGLMVGTSFAAVTGRNASSTSASLLGLELSAGILAQPFDPDTLEYTSGVAYTTGSLRVTPSPSDASATVQVQVNGGGYVTVASGSVSSPLPLNVGANTVQLQVTAPDASTTKTYTIRVTRALQVQPSLSRTISCGNLILSWSDPAFTLCYGTNVTAITNRISGESSPYIHTVAAPETYFRLVCP
jgi:hypothetical protein